VFVFQYYRPLRAPNLYAGLRAYAIRINVYFITFFQEKKLYILFGDSQAQIHFRAHRMEDNRVDGLIEQVRALTIQVQELQQKLRRRDNSPSSRQRNKASETTGTDKPKFKAGDRVRILNQVKKPTSWDGLQEWLSSRAKTATVTSTSGQRVFFTTDNGISTWRSPRNLVLIE
jgi:hypothetical protein